MRLRTLMILALFSAALLTETSVANASCVIKGNISDKGERIYHVPGGAFYGKTVINPSRGERMFCSEKEAVAAGWRKSKR